MFDNCVQQDLELIYLYIENNLTMKIYFFYKNTDFTKSVLNI